MSSLFVGFNVQQRGEMQLLGRFGEMTFSRRDVLIAVFRFFGRAGHSRWTRTPTKIQLRIRLTDRLDGRRRRRRNWIKYKRIRSNWRITRTSATRRFFFHRFDRRRGRAFVLFLRQGGRRHRHRRGRRKFGTRRKFVEGRRRRRMTENDRH